MIRKNDDRGTGSWNSACYPRPRVRFTIRKPVSSLLMRKYTGGNTRDIQVRCVSQSSFLSISSGSLCTFDIMHSILLIGHDIIFLLQK